MKPVKAEIVLSKDQGSGLNKIIVDGHDITKATLSGSVSFQAGGVSILNLELYCEAEIIGEGMAALIEKLTPAADAEKEKAGG